MSPSFDPVRTRSGAGNRGRLRSRVVGAAALVAFSAIAAAGGVPGFAATLSSGHSAAGIAAAQADVKRYSVLPKWQAPGPPVKASKARGKTCAYVPVAAGIPFTNFSYAGFKAAAKVVGVKTKFFSTAGSPQTWSQAIEQAVGQNVDCIVTQGVNLAVVQSAVHRAAKAHIPIIESFIREPQLGPNPGGFAEVAPSCKAVGVALGAYAVVQSKQKIDATIFTSSDSPCSNPLVSGIQSEMAKTCGSGCKTHVVDVPVADWATKLGSETSSALTSRPDTNWLFPLYDGEMGYVIPAVRQAGAVTKVQAGSYNATPGIVGDIPGHLVLTADVGSPYTWYGYGLMDEALRAMTGMKAAPGAKEQIPIVLFTSSNFTSAMNKQPPDTWYGAAGKSVASDFQKLWGIKH
jgi:ribose transport system substrate-binding protein